MRMRLRSPEGESFRIGRKVWNRPFRKWTVVWYVNTSAIHWRLRGEEEGTERCQVDSYGAEG